MCTYTKISKVFEDNPDVLFGFSDLYYSNFQEKYETALVFAVPHEKMMHLSNYDEAIFEAYIQQARQRSHEIMEHLGFILDELHIKYEFPPLAQSSEETLLAPLSFKFAAVHAGLGWIGKNDVLITPQYGPRVRLSVVLLNAQLPSGAPVYQSYCPETCVLCVDACPYHALTGRIWNIQSKRSDLIDYVLCNQKRSLYLLTHHRKHACGFCMVSCPIGQSEVVNAT